MLKKGARRSYDMFCQDPRHLIIWSSFLVLVLIGSSSAAAQTAESDSSKGIPIDNATVKQACSSCHVADEKGRLSRISFRRTTPEGWQQTIRRMVTLNGVDLDPETAREVVRYLSNTLGLAPEEAYPAAYEVERRADDQPYKDAGIQETCTQCHSMGRVLNQRRTSKEWALLMAMHRGYYPFTDFQAFRRSGPATDEPQPVDQAIKHLSEHFPFQTSEWAAWSATMRPARVAGTWLIRGQALGLGPVYGSFTITPVPDTEDEFTTATTYTYARNGRRVTRTGQAIIYTGFQWRGRSSEDNGNTHREVMFVDRDLRTMRGRWFTGSYDEEGIDITLERADSQPVIAGVHPLALSTGTTETLRLYGLNLTGESPSNSIDLGPGIEIMEVLGNNDESFDIRVHVDAEASHGYRDLFFDRSNISNAIAVYDEVDRITVMPSTGMARVGGIRFPKQYQQFEARAYNDGPDGESNTADDLDLGIIDANWSIEEYAVTIGDDDTQYVGSIDGSGLFTPSLDGPNVERSGERNNIGDVWVTATYPAQTMSRSQLRARGHLVVTVPLYLRWDPTAVEQP
tara:strand:- start:3144 stop:4853 length:1710 start_codon:yes stop_codon:yes gene_type:complete